MDICPSTSSSGRIVCRLRERERERDRERKREKEKEKKKGKFLSHIANINSLSRSYVEKENL